MDWKLAATAFTTVFLAEMGDKTQLAALLLTARSGKPLQVFLAAAAALVLATALGAAAGAWIGRLVPPDVLKRAAAVLFVLLGVWMWVRK